MAIGRDSVHRARTSDANERDRGYSLIESVLVIVLVGILILPVMSAMQSLIVASSISRSATRVETALMNATDRVVRAPKSCDYTVYVQAAVLIEGWNADLADVTHEYLVPGTASSGSPTWSSGGPDAPACPDVRSSDGLIQRLTISVTSPDGRIQREVQVIKSDV